MDSEDIEMLELKGMLPERTVSAMAGRGMKRCILCGKQFSEYGNNPEPLAKFEEGKACNECDDLKVVPARLRRIGYTPTDADAVGESLRNIRRKREGEGIK